MNQAMNAGDITQVSIIERWGWWQRAMKNPDAVGSADLPVHPGEFQCGYFRVRKKGGNWEPVGIYPDDDGVVVAFRGDRQVTDIHELFTWACRQPVTFDAYMAAQEGKGWEDDPPATAGIGDNSAEADPFDALNIEYLGEKELAEEFMKTPVATQAQADKVAVWCDRISKVKSRAKALHTEEKRPWLEGGAKCDDKWRPLAHDKDGETTALIARLRNHLTPFLLAQKRAEEERQRNAREEAERVRREADEVAARAREMDGEQDAVQREVARQAAEEAAARVRAAEREAEARKITAGRTGAKTGIRVEKKGEIVDYDAFVMAVRNRDEVRELMQSLANRAAKSGFQVDGMKIIDVEKVV